MGRRKFGSRPYRVLNPSCNLSFLLASHGLKYFLTSRSNKLVPQIPVTSFALSGVWQGFHSGAVSYHIPVIHPSLIFPYCHDFGTQLKSIRTVSPLQTSEETTEITDYLSLPKWSSVHMCEHLSLGLSLCCLQFKDILLTKWQCFSSKIGLSWDPVRANLSCSFKCECPQRDSLFVKQDQITLAN